MGTQFNGKKPQNRITISKGTDVTRRINADGEVDRSVAQPNPALPPRVVEPKAHASLEDETEALKKNSVKGRDYKKSDEQQDDDGGSDE